MAEDEERPLGTDLRGATIEVNRLVMMLMVEGHLHLMHTVAMRHHLLNLQIHMQHTTPTRHGQVCQELKALPRCQDWNTKESLVKLLRWMRHQGALPLHPKASVSLVS